MITERSLFAVEVSIRGVIENQSIDQMENRGSAHAKHECGVITRRRLVRDTVFDRVAKPLDWIIDPIAD